MQLRNTQRNALDRDSFMFGFILALIFPVVMYGVLLAIYDGLEDVLLASDLGFAEDFRTRTLMLIAICCNLILFHLYQKWGRDTTMRGMVFPTLLFVVYWFVMYGRHLVGL
jgi:hypothetical protein